jgi:uracil DNA glycosylase superfamily protein
MPAATFGSRAVRFYGKLHAPAVPAGVRVMNPYAEPRVRGYVRAFLTRYFDDNQPRVLVFGINPGRFGAGLTGVTFTDPVVLADVCGIANHLPRRRELSSIFVYAFIERWGGARRFYRQFFLTAVSPLGFTRDHTNLNYYDVPALARRITPFIIDGVRRQIALGSRTDHAIVLGMGQNMRFVKALNDQHGFFREIHALEHPRFIMQYRRKQLDRYLDKYASVFALAGR